MVLFNMQHAHAFPESVVPATTQQRSCSASMNIIGKGVQLEAVIALAAHHSQQSGLFHQSYQRNLKLYKTCKL
jgi:hypothetical protein